MVRHLHFLPRGRRAAEHRPATDFNPCFTVIEFDAVIVSKQTARFKRNDLSCRDASQPNSALPASGDANTGREDSGTTIPAALPRSVDGDPTRIISISDSRNGHRRFTNSRDHPAEVRAG